ncbi:hypothetical protein J5U21_01852 [Saccharolobus shibatae]|uniref:Uncharacterized protein n=1 Tax=Saccharolobus shibatae TaxID=2286 RepID=A0A8F5BVT5_9CREN|nr:hypothetical protein J5U21_01852 [Saccharolobus shibatae]
MDVKEDYSIKHMKSLLIIYNEKKLTLISRHVKNIRKSNMIFL